jgi:hypothetical protein
MKGKKIQEKLSCYQLEQKHFMKTKDGRAVTKLGKLPWKKREPKKMLELWADIRLMLSEGKDDAFWPTPRCFFEYGLYDIGDVMRNEDESIYSLQRGYYAGKIRELEKELKKIKMTLRSNKYEKQMGYLKELSSGYIKNSLYDRYQDQPYEFNALVYKEAYDEFVSFLKRYPAIMCTADSLKDSIRRNYVYDYLIIDEASETDVMTGLQVLSCCKNAVIFGDSKQPAPSFMTSVTDVFRESAPGTILREQYLCHPGVVRYFNEKFYEDELIAYSEQETPEIPETPENPETPETPEPGSMYYLKQADKLAQALKVSLKKEDDLSLYVKYLCVDEYISDDDAIPVYSLLYKDYNAVLLSLQNKFPRRSKYKLKTRLFSAIGEILKDQKYRHINFRYDVRLADLIKTGNENTDNSIFDFVLYNVFGNKPELLIEIGDNHRQNE